MTYCLIVDIPAPVERYDATHAELLRRTGGDVDGLLVHLCRSTTEGFRVIEVWASKDDYEQCNRDLVVPILAAVGAVPPGPQPDPHTEEFELRGLVVPAGPIVI
jgi:hypothetical protein